MADWNNAWEGVLRELDALTAADLTRVIAYPAWVGIRNQLLVKVETDEGIVGWGEALTTSVTVKYCCMFRAFSPATAKLPGNWFICFSPLPPSPCA